MRTRRNTNLDALLDLLWQQIENMTFMSLEAKADIIREGATPEQVAIMEDHVLTFYSGAVACYGKLAKVHEHLLTTNDLHATYSQLVQIQDILVEMRRMMPSVNSSLPLKWTDETANRVNRLERHYAEALGFYEEANARPARRRY